MKLYENRPTANLSSTAPSASSIMSVHRIAYGGAHTSDNREAQIDLAMMADEMIGLIAEKKIDPMVKQLIGLEDIPEGLAQLETRHVRGKIVAELV